MTSTVTQLHAGKLTPAIDDTLAALPLTPEDQATAQLARTYATALDRAAAIEAQADKVLRQVDEDDTELHQLVSALKAKLSAQTALATIGPKLLDALTALGAHPKARAAIGKGGADHGNGKLAGLRAGRQP